MSSFVPTRIEKPVLSFTFSGKHITYTKTHALILNHNKHITVTDLIIFMNSYNRFTYIIILVTNLCLYIRSYTYDILILILISRMTHTYIDFLVCGTELIHILILISRMTHNYSDSSYTILNLYIYLNRGTYPHIHTSIYHILVQISRRSYRAYAYTEVPLGTTKLIFRS